MTLGPTASERRARARADLRMGVPVILRLGGTQALAVAAETLSRARLAELLRLGAPVLAITARRAATLNARAYDTDLARLSLPSDVSLDWIQAVANPADDLSNPMKGPFHSERGGTCDLHRAAIVLAKEARLLPSALILPLDDIADAKAEIFQSMGPEDVAVIPADLPQTGRLASLAREAGVGRGGRGSGGGGGCSP